MRSLILFALASLSPAVALGEGLGRPAYTWDQGRFEFGPRLSHLTLTDEATERELELGGIGGYVRYRFGPRLGLEVSLDALGADELGDGSVVRVTMPLLASGMIYLFPEDRLQLYFLLGGGVAGNSVRYEALGETLTFATPMSEAGVGLEYRFDSWRADVSVRGLYLRREAGDVERRPMGEGAPGTVSYVALDGPREEGGALLQLGVHWGF